MEKLNDVIFNSVKGSLNGDDMLVKICMGTATEEEKKKWQDEKGLSDEIISSLKEYCDIGYNTACQLDCQVEQQRKLETVKENEYASLVENLQVLTLEISNLKSRIEHLENIRSESIESARVLELYNNNL